VLSRAARRLQALGVGIKGGFARTHRSVQRRLRGDKAKTSMKKPYRRLLAVTSRVLRQAQRMAQSARRKLASMPKAARSKAKRALATIARTLPRGEQVVRQTRARVLRGVTDSAGKIISIFEPCPTKPTRRCSCLRCSGTLSTLGVRP
jgi:exonuclease VII large subunit